MGQIVVGDLYLRIHFAFFSAYELAKILDIDDAVYEEGVCHFYANMSLLDVPEGTNPIMRLVVLNTPMEFNLSDLCKNSRAT